MISIRLSDEEYRILRDVCAAEHSQSISDVARAAIHKLLDDRGKDRAHHVDSRMNDFEGRLIVLGDQVARIARLVERTAREE
jgi:hypothetical protein